MPTLVRAFVVSLLVLASLEISTPVTAVQTQQALSDGMVASAAIEVPELIERLGLSPGMTVADIGAGFGAWTMAFGKFLGPKGHVYATDVGERQLTFLREYAAKEGLTNVTVLAGAERSTNLPASCCDAILIRDAYHHLTQPNNVVRSMSAALKPGGRLAVIDFPPRQNSPIPDGVPADRRGHGVPMEIVVREISANGFSVVSEHATWSPKSQPNDLFLVVFRKN